MFSVTFLSGFCPQTISLKVKAFPSTRYGYQSYYQARPTIVIACIFKYCFKRVPKLHDIVFYPGIYMLASLDYTNVYKVSQTTRTFIEIGIRVDRKTLRNGLYLDLIQDISLEKRQHKKTPSKTPSATAR